MFVPKFVTDIIATKPTHIQEEIKNDEKSHIPGREGDERAFVKITEKFAEIDSKTNGLVSTAETEHIKNQIARTAAESVNDDFAYDAITEERLAAEIQKAQEQRG